MRFHLRLKPMFVVLALSLAALVAACTGGGDETATPSSTSPAGSPVPSADVGTLEVRVTDAPNWEITEIYLTASEIEVAGSNDGWVTVVPDPVTFELLALEGVEAIIGESTLEPGRYTQVRLAVPEVEVVVDGESIIAEVPSEKLRLVGTFTIEAGKKTFISLDFDAEQSLVQRGPNGYLFKPVIKLEVGEPGDEGEDPVELPVKPENGDGQATATPGGPATPTAQATAAPTDTPEPTPTPDPIGAFFLSIESPVEPEVVVQSAQFEVAGRTTVDAFVTVNDEIAEIDADGQFAVVVNLEEGPNVVEVVASTVAGDQDSRVLVIIYEPPA